MMPSHDFKLRVVAIDDDEQHLKFIATSLSRQNVVVSTSGSPRDGLELVRKEHPHLVLSDLMMPEMSGMDLLERILEFDPGTEIILLTGQYSTESAVEAIQKGAADYLTKPVDMEKLEQRVESLLLEVRRGQRCLELENELLENSQFAAMVGHSPAMLEVFHRIRRVAPHFRSVLVTGEPGGGKELAAQALHRLSPVASGPFVTCNCSAVVETLAESELFGHVKGAFTGAVQDRSEEHTSELQSPDHLVCRLLLEKKNKTAEIYARLDKNDWRIQPAEFYRLHAAEVNTFGYC